MYIQKAERPTNEVENTSGFDKQELEEIKDVFRYFDTDHNKYLDKRELNNLFKHQIGTQLHKENFDLVSQYLFKYYVFFFKLLS